MSSASLVEKGTIRKKGGYYRSIETSSSSITSAPATAAEKNAKQQQYRMKDKKKQLHHREKLPDIDPGAVRKKTRNSTWELSNTNDDYGNDKYENYENNAPRKVKPAGTTKKPKRSNSNVTVTGLNPINSNLPEILTIGGNDRHTDDSMLEQLRMDLIQQKSYRDQARIELNGLRKELNEYQQLADEEIRNPVSEYDQSIAEKRCFNATLKTQITESKEKLKNLSQSLKTLQTCGKDCNIHMRDLIIDYNCITKNELSKEIKRFQRMEIDLKNNLDRLHWRLDCESKMYHNLLDQYHKLQMDLYYLKNLNEATSPSKHIC